jgi:murein tripeptide amidase MpaA
MPGLYPGNAVQDNANLPDDDYGWNGQRSLRMGEAVLTPIYAVINELR